MAARTSTALAADFPVDSAEIQATIDCIDYLTQNGFISGVALGQVLSEIGSAMDAWGETPDPPLAAYTGAAGSITRYYVVAFEYALNIDAPPRPFPFRNLGRMPGIPLGGRGPLAVDRVKRYSKASAILSVTNTATTLNSTDFVTLTVPNYAGPVGGVSCAVVAVDATGKPVSAVASGVAPGGTAVDEGTVLYGGVPALPVHTEFALAPAAAASGGVAVVGRFTPGGVLSVDVGGITATYTVAAGDTDLNGVATALAAAIAAAQPLVSATATGPSIAIKALATGRTGNMNLSTKSTSTTISLTSSFSLAGGTPGGGVYGPRTVATPTGA